jgi:ELWxxDGT repeat protein
VFSSDPGPGVALGGFFYFFASDGAPGAFGRELWRTDGTTAGTTLVKDIRPGSEDSSDLIRSPLLTVVGSRIYFVANDGVHGRELWKSDGTKVGTAMVADLTPGPDGSDIYLIKPAGSVAYFGWRFTSDQRLYKTDGTTNGTVVVAGVGGIATTAPLFTFFDTFGTNVVFIANPPGSLVIWRSDGTAGGSQMLESPLAMNGISGLRALGTEVFVAGDAGADSVLKRRSLTPGGIAQTADTADTVFVQDVSSTHLFYVKENFNAGARDLILASVVNGQAPVVRDSFHDPSAPFDFLEGVFIGGALYYRLTGSPVLRRTDGSVNGVVAVDFAALGITPASFSAFFAAGSRLFFEGSTAAAGVEPGVTGGTPATTVLLDVVAGNTSSNPGFMGHLGNTIFFSADDGVNGRELWKTDGTQAGTMLVKDIAPGTATLAPVEAAVAGSTLFLSVDSPGNGRELWKSDGTGLGTMLVKDIRPGAMGSNPTNLTAFNGVLYFAADDGTNGMELWRSDGTAPGTLMVKDIRLGASGSNPAQLRAAGGLLFFVADNGSVGAELWRSDGTTPGTFLAADVVGGPDPGQIGNLTAVDDVVYFKAFAGSAGVELWRSDGQPGGTQFLQNLRPAATSSDPKHFTAFGGAVFFIESGSGLWRTDGTGPGTSLIKIAFSFSELCHAGGTLYLALADELWKSDGTDPGTVLLKDTGVTTSVTNLTTVGTNAYFVANDDVWISDGTTNGTFAAADFPETTSAADSPRMLTVFAGALIFTEKNTAFGRELWSTAPGQNATMIEDLVPGAGDADIRFLVAAPDRIFYIARPPFQPAWQVRALHLQSIMPPARGPFGGSPAGAPGRIEAEHFDIGGEGVAYHDTTIFNEGGQFRLSEAVDLETCTDTNGGFCVSSTQSGEWLEYTFEAAFPGAYRLDLRAASAAPGAMFHISIDGANVGNTIVLPGTGENWTIVEVPNIIMNTGVHVLRLTFDATSSAGDAGRFNWLEFVLTAENQPPFVTITSPGHGDFFAPSNRILLSASIIDATTETPVRGEFFIDGQSVGVATTGRVFWDTTPGAHVLRVTATDSFGLSTTSAGRLFFVSDPIVPFGDRWRYMDAGTNQGIAWRQLNFDDRTWLSGAGEFGFGDGDEATVIDGGRPQTPHITHYFRHRLTTNLTGMNYAAIQLRRDDGAVVYVTGQEVARVNLPRPPAVIGFNTLAVTNVGFLLFGNEIGEPALDLLPIPISAFTNGTNLLAVELHQSSVVSPESRFDLSFDLALFAFAYDALLTIEAVNNRAIVRWPDYLADWELEQSTDLATWAPATEALRLADGFFVVIAPMQAQEFFRLRHAPAP